MEHKKRFWVWLAVVIVMIALAVCLVFWKNNGVPKVTPKSTVIANVPSGQLPAGLPSNIPLEKGAPVVSNFNAATQNGQVQATRSFKSSKTAAQNISLYAGFLANPANGWKVITSSTDSLGDKTMVAKNVGALLTIRVSQIPPRPMPASLVEITYVTNPPSAK
jgi:hypothetical protein